jgi:hypothetical protein
VDPDPDPGRQKMTHKKKHSFDELDVWSLEILRGNLREEKPKQIF